jgi:hypothetical protein
VQIEFIHLIRKLSQKYDKNTEFFYYYASYGKTDYSKSAVACTASVHAVLHFTTHLYICYCSFLINKWTEFRKTAAEACDLASGQKLVLTTPSMAMYSSFRGLTILKSRSIHSKIAIIISSSFLGAGLKITKWLFYNLLNSNVQLFVLILFAVPASFILSNNVL